MQKRLHNPKSHAPSVYIPCWLLQVPSDHLSHAAKILYGRLSQWATESGKVYRSSSQLAEEIGAPIRSIERYLKELRFVGLIGTYHPQAGGVNHFEFYDHPWMYEKIKEQLVYKSFPNNPPSNLTVPPDNFVGTPPSKVADINIKEIKEIKETKTLPDFEKSGKKKKGISSQKDYQKDERFMKFYKAYPKKEDPRDAYKAFNSIVGDNDELLELIIADIEKRKQKHSRWSDRQYIKHPAVYLRKGEYLGEIYNQEQDIKEKSERTRIENEQKELLQEQMSRKRADEILKNNISKQEDAVIYRKTIKESSIKNNVRPSGLVNLRNQLGIS